MRRGRVLVPPNASRTSSHLPGQRRGGRRAMECRDPRAFALLCAAMFFVYSDQNLMAPNLSQIADFFGYDDDERDSKLGGQISVAFFLLGLPATLIIGLLCDVVQRKKVLVATLLLGQGPCLLTIFVTEYWQLFALRTLTGIAVGGALPLVYSIAGDLFPPTSRAYASAMVGICSSLGSMCGQGVAGFMGPTFGWRLPFAAVAAPGLVVAWLVHAFAEEPARGVAEGKAGEEDGDDRSVGKVSGKYAADTAAETLAAADGATVHKTKTSAEDGDASENARVTATRLALDFARKSRSVVSRRTNVLGFLQGVPGCVPWSIISVFMNDYLANDKGLGVEAATSLLMCFGLGAMGGTVGGGVVGQRLYNASPVYATTFMGAAAVAGIFPWLFLVHADDYDGNDASAMSQKCAVAIFAGLLCSVTGVNVRAMTVNVNDPRERGTAFAWFNLTDDLGKGFGPVLIAALIHRMGRQKAFELGFWFWVPCGVLCALCGLTVPRDEARVRRENESSRQRRGGGEGETAALLGKGGDKMV